MDNFFGMLQLAIGAYLLYCGITGSGKIYENDSIKKGMEKLYRKRMRQFSLVLGPLMIATGATEYLLSGKSYYSIVLYTAWGLTVIAMAVLLYVTVKMTDRTKAKRPKGEKPAPRSAFEFDEDESEK